MSDGDSSSARGEGDSAMSEHPAVDVVASVIERSGRLLLCQRPQGKRHGGLWEFPGGKLLPGEDMQTAIRRELAEELHLHVESVRAHMLSVPDEGSNFVIHFFEVVASGTPNPMEHDRAEWVPVSELANLPLAPADARFVEVVLIGPG